MVDKLYNLIHKLFSEMYGQPVAQQKNSEEVDKLTKTLEEQAQIIRDLKEQLDKKEKNPNQEKEQKEDSKTKPEK